MWHLLGPFVRWPLHSPWRLLGVVAAGIVAIALLGAINDRGAAPTTAPHETRTSNAAQLQRDVPPSHSTGTPLPTSSRTERPGVGAGGTDAWSDDPADQDPLVAAEEATAQFIAAWARPDLDSTAWQAGLAPLTTPQFLQALTDTDPSNVPAVTVAGQPVRVAANAEAGVFDVPTTGEFVRVFVQLVDGVWLAADVQPTT
ncbi:hypothetical protein ACWFNE_09340 [Cellulomonas sp. NPDC055163]